MRFFTPAPLIRLGILCLLLFSLISTTPKPTVAQSPGLTDLVDWINTVDPLETATHDISFTLPADSLQMNPTDYLRIFFFQQTNPSTLSATLSGTFSGTPTFVATGNAVLISGITLPPGGNLNIYGITTVNPYYFSPFLVNVLIADNPEGVPYKNGGTTAPVLRLPVIDMTAIVGNPNANLQISGLAAPYTYVIFTEGVSTIGTGYTSPIGYFSRLFTAIPGGSHSITFYGIDQQDRVTSTINLDVTTPVYQTTHVTNQLLSPTIQVDDVSLEQGDPLYATGSAAPNATITLFTDSPLRSYATTSSSLGDWTYTITDTDTYSPGDFRVYGLAQTIGGLQSIFSPAVFFTINSTNPGSGTACGDISQGDLNCDTNVDLIDFSVLMYYWGTTSPAADINEDGRVDLVDFSVLMYYWGT